MSFVYIFKNAVTCRITSERSTADITQRYFIKCSWFLQKCFQCQTESRS